MELNGIKTKLVSAIKKYKYAIIILLIGLVLMLLPSRQSSEIVSTPSETISKEVCNISEELAQILSKVESAGDVKVFLTIESGEITLYQTDEDITVAESNSTTHISTVMITGDDRGENGLVKQINPPVYKGAIVVCQGADDPKVRLAIVDAVATVTGLGADRISVLKMK